jgi:PAS domain S-box-containing protein
MATSANTARKNAEEHLTKMEGRYRNLLEAAPDAMIVVNQAGEIVLLNLQAEKQFGYSRDELVGQKVTNIIPQGFAERLIADGLRSDEEALAQQIGTGIELSAVRKDASEFPIELMLSPLESADGILVTAAIRNISVRKAAEEHLTKTEARYRGLLEAAPDAMVVVNQAGEIVLLNLQAEKQFGYSRDELVGQKVTNIIPQGFAERLIADGLRSADEALAQQIGTGIELTALRKDASEFPIELMLSPLESVDGILVTAAIRDISVRKAAEELQAKTEARYRGLLEAAPDAMVVVNQAGEIVLLNLQAEKQFGYSRDELVGQKVTNIIPQGFAERLIADGLRSAEEALAQQIGTGIELTALRKNGSEFPIELMLSPLESTDGILVTAAIRDIATRRELEHQFRQAQKMEAVGQLTGGVAHDFNNLLTVITCTIEGIAEAVADNPELLAMAKSIDQAAERGAQLTQRMLAFARKQPLQSRTLDLNEVATRMMGMLRRMLSEDIDVKTKLGAELWTATADGNQVEDAILNLAINARDAMPTGGNLVIETDNVTLDKRYAAHNAEVTPGDYVSIAVSDSGTGMSADIMERAFEPFYTTKEVGRGTGLGLSMVYGFAKQSRGHVKIYSEVGQGTTIRLFLPRAAPDSASQIAAKSSVQERRPGNETILVVEDDPLVRGVVLTMLRGLGYRVREAADAQAALNILSQGDPIDLLFTDIVMPGGMSGWELVEAARIERPALKALFTSGYSDRILKERARGGMDIRLLAKPYRSRSLGEAIRAVLDHDGDLAPITRQA